MRLRLNKHTFELPRPAVMGVLNVTPDSFSDGGRYLDPASALKRAGEMIAHGASVIDIGGESTRPGSDPVPVQEELDRILPVVRALPKDRVLLSVDSSKVEVQDAVLREGVHIINDIMGGSRELFQMAERHRAGLVLMHTSGPPKIMQKKTEYDDVTGDIHRYFSQKHTELQGYDVPAVWADPGIGFGKTFDQNIRLMRDVERFRFPGWRLLVGVSRKSWIGKLGGANVSERLGGSLAALVIMANKGVDLFRVHDVRESVQALEVARLLTATS